MEDIDEIQIPEVLRAADGSSIEIRGVSCVDVSGKDLMIDRRGKLRIVMVSESSGRAWVEFIDGRDKIGRPSEACWSIRVDMKMLPMTQKEIDLVGRDPSGSSDYRLVAPAAQG